jgi:4-diphosphocytidyl-2-C-methyl-D-erythritol kinase
VSADVVADAPAKINLVLRVGPPRADGYHDIATLFHAVDLRDTVRATGTTDGSIEVTTRTAKGGPVPGVVDDDTNLAVRAAQALRARDGSARAAHLGARLHITKRIPVAGGMAGGSADAAATLVACRALWALDVDDAELRGIAAELGSDVPFALLGGTALGTGRGERLRPVPVDRRLHWVVAPADGGGLSTPRVYARCDALRAGQSVPSPSIDPATLDALTGPPTVVADLLGNDLQPAALDLRPDLARTLATGRAAGALAGLVSGSGPTCVFLVGDDASARRVATELERRHHSSTVQTSGPAPGARVLQAANGR